MTKPNATSPELQKAKKVHGRGDAAGARVLYEHILQADPADAEAQHFLGIALHQLGESDRADVMLRETLMREPENAEWWNNYGNVLAAQNKLPGAERAFRQVVALQPRRADAWANLGTTLQRQGHLSQAEEAYREVLKLEAESVVGLKLLGTLLQQQNRTIEGARFLARALILETDAAKSPFEVAKAWLILNEPAKAAEVYAKLMRDHPENPAAAFLHAACTGIDVPTGCTKEYVESIFDAYAPTFDQVQDSLAYRGPEMMSEILTQITLPAAPLDILDLGCGTGKCAKILRPIARTLVGVDLSQKMLNRAAEVQLYTELIHADLIDYLSRHPASFDLLTSGECFIYFGELQKVFAAMATGLRPGGTALFTIETLTGSDASYRLHSVGRYCHSREYVTAMCRDHNFEVLHIDTGVLRVELCLPVEGAMWAVRKLASES